MVIIKHYFASGIPTCYIPEFQPAIMTIDCDFMNTIYEYLLHAYVFPYTFFDMHSFTYRIHDNDAIGMHLYNPSDPHGPPLDWPLMQDV